MLRQLNDERHLHDLPRDEFAAQLTHYYAEINAVHPFLRRTGAKRRNLSPVRSDDYAAVIVVIFTEDLRVEQAIRVPQPVVNELFAWREHGAGRVITVTKRLLAHPKVRKIDLSDALLDASIKAKRQYKRGIGSLCIAGPVSAWGLPWGVLTV